MGYCTCRGINYSVKTFMCETAPRTPLRVCVCVCVSVCTCRVIIYYVKTYMCETAPRTPLRVCVCVCVCVCVREGCVLRECVCVCVCVCVWWRIKLMNLVSIRYVLFFCRA